MYLQKYLRPFFEDSSRKAGAALFSGKSVQAEHSDLWRFVALVATEFRVVLELQRKRNTLDAFCQCEAYTASGRCKHIWAAILAAETQQALLGRMGVAITLSEFPSLGVDLPTPTAPSRQAAPPVWESLLREVQQSYSHTVRSDEDWKPGTEIYYILEPESWHERDQMWIALEVRETTASGQLGRLKANRLRRSQIPRIEDPLHREILSQIAGPHTDQEEASDWLPQGCYITPPFLDSLLPKICATGHCRFRAGREASFGDTRVVLWETANPWRFEAALSREGEDYSFQGRFLVDTDYLPLTKPQSIYSNGLLLANDTIYPYTPSSALVWMKALRRSGPMRVAAAQAAQFQRDLLQSPSPPPLTWPEELEVEDFHAAPEPCLRFLTPSWSRERTTLQGTLGFQYSSHFFAWDQAGEGVFSQEERRFLHRNRAQEDIYRARLSELGLKSSRTGYSLSSNTFELTTKRLPAVVRTLVQEGWHVEAEGKLFRSASQFHAELRSGVDWFELDGAIEYGEASIQLPALIQALEKGDNLVRLDDGSYGMIPEDFLAKYGMLLKVGRIEDGALRFSRAQTGLLDIFLAERDAEIQVDEVFAAARAKIQSFAGILPAAQPAGFLGELRHYQKEGLGWLYFLEECGWGGCLADDMGVGKTAQVLALLEKRREQGHGPSIVVVPRSLIYNWIQEAARFAPQLKVLDHSGPGRVIDEENFRAHNIVLMTYGTMRSDILSLKAIQFDYAILDEAQAIKNAASESAKASRLLRAKNRLAMSGTPIENHLGELWSLFEFLNPGMLGGATPLAADLFRNPEPETRQLLARALRPFVLRRTKEQVVQELPAKTESTIYCELDTGQRKLYDELRDYYRLNLLGKITNKSMGKAKLQVLEALLRMRQAACHPGLIDSSRHAESSAKFDILIPMLEELLNEGHKALIFSQFTSLLALLKLRLDKKNLVYEYLDGSTKDRQERVERFQNDPGCKLFLISLKAGGTGLNLTGADYVFLLDPWWNPAVEAQAIDRTHRIGQTRPVFAYRLVARGTVEEKVLELQQSKRELADSILTEDNRLIGNLQREDLELLFG